MSAAKSTRASSQYITHFTGETSQKVAQSIREAQSEDEKIVAITAYATEGANRGFGYFPQHHAIVVYER